MKRILLLTISLIILSCSNDDSDEQNNNLINSFNVEQSSSELNFNYSSNSNFNYFEIAYTISTNSIDPSSADRFATNEQNSTSKSISELLIQTDILYSFWIRGFDANGNSTDWFGPRTISISEFCEDIYDLEFNGYIAWNYYNNDTEASYFQAQYGVQGFELGNGEIIQTNDETIWDVTLEQGNIYDVYVRANCENNLGFSQWIGPASYFASENFNVCMEPYNLGYFTEYNFFGDPVGANISWNDDGNNKTYEFNLVGNLQSPETGAIETRNDYGTQITYVQLTPNALYNFYVRTVCLDGSRTDWVGPLIIQIN